jgi:hypothetical protein
MVGKGRFRPGRDLLPFVGKENDEIVLLPFLGRFVEPSLLSDREAFHALCMRFFLPFGASACTFMRNTIHQ